MRPDNGFWQIGHCGHILASGYFGLLENLHQRDVKAGRGVDGIPTGRVLLGATNRNPLRGGEKSNGIWCRE